MTVQARCDSASRADFLLPADSEAEGERGVSDHCRGRTQRRGPD